MQTEKILDFINKEMDILEGEQIILQLQTKDIEEPPQSFFEMKEKLASMLSASRLAIEAETKIALLKRLAEFMNLNESI
jgi:hypothetical protein